MSTKWDIFWLNTEVFNVCDSRSSLFPLRSTLMDLTGYVPGISEKEKEKQVSSLIALDINPLIKLVDKKLYHIHDGP